MRSIEARRMLVGALVVGGLCGLELAWGLDVADVNPEWTPEGKKIAAQRAKLPGYDERVLVPAGWSSWAATRRWIRTLMRRSSRDVRSTSMGSRSTSMK